MPRIFDNIDKQLLPTLRETLEVSDRANFFVGYYEEEQNGEPQIICSMG